MPTEPSPPSSSSQLEPSSSEHEQAAPLLERPPRTRRRIWLRIAISAVITAMMATTVVSVYLLTRPPKETTTSQPPAGSSCEWAIRAVVDVVAVGFCQREYAATRHPITGRRAADLLRKVGEYKAARAIATVLLAETPLRADALAILGKIEMSENRFEEAKDQLEQARDLHRSNKQFADVAFDELALAQVHTKMDNYGEALLALDECLENAHTASDAEAERYCRITAVRVLSRAGMYELAEDEIKRIIPASPREELDLLFQVADLNQTREGLPGKEKLHGTAIVLFRKVIELNKEVQKPDLTIEAHLNIAYSAAQHGDLDEARRALEEAEQLDTSGKNIEQRTQIKARIAFLGGDLNEAAMLNERAYPLSDDRDERIDIAAMQSKIALKHGDYALAAEWAERGISEIEQIRSMQSSIGIRALVSSIRRAPYESLFLAHARAGRPADAWLAIDRWMGRTVLDAIARDGADSPSDIRGAALQLQRLDQWLPPALDAQVGALPSTTAVLEALRTTDVLALVVADGRIWRATSLNGKLEVSPIVTLESLDLLIDDFRTKPHQVGFATELGDKLLRGYAVRTTSEPLHVLLDGPLAQLPIAALRPGGELLVSKRPLLRISRVLTTTCASRTRGSGAAVLADVQGDLPESRREAAEAGKVLNVTPLLGEAATPEALFGAAGAAVLHISVHGALKGGIGVLKLHNRDVPAPEIASKKRLPWLVVLSSCLSAASSDPDLVSSVATAFLIGGSTRVVAATRPITDPGASEVIQEFYRAGGANDPVHALANVQAKLASTKNTDWPDIAVFGRDVCREVAPDASVRRNRN